MIRDPSDGSVREPPTCKESLQVQSGMREPDQHAKDELERLSKSREWLKEYHAAVDRANQMNDKGEISE